MNHDDTNKIRGQCLCGSVKFTLLGQLRPVKVCHCQQCRRWSGHLVAATSVATKEQVDIPDTTTLSWYPSSPKARRGFCTRCGSSLFWETDDYICIMTGTLDSPTALSVEGHIYVANKGDYYQITDSLPQHDGSDRSS